MLEDIMKEIQDVIEDLEDWYIVEELDDIRYVDCWDEYDIQDYNNSFKAKQIKSLLITALQKIDIAKNLVLLLE